MTKGKRTLVGLLSIILFACGASNQNYPTSVALTATENIKVATQPATIITSEVTATVLPTLPPPELPNDTLWNELQSQEYKLVTSASIAAGDGNIYAAYLLTDAKLNSIMLNKGLVVDISTITGPGVCLLVFYHWNGYNYMPIHTEGKTDEPIWCQVIDWDNTTSQTFFPFNPPDTAARQALGLKGYWSDINGNGFPELAVIYEYCFNNCQTYDGVKVRFYELSGTTIVDIAANLAGTITPDSILHSDNPPSIYVYEPVEFASRQQVEWTSIYTWEGDKFVNVSTKYPEYYRQQIEQTVVQLQKNYGRFVPPYITSPFLTILGIYNEAELPRAEGLTTFLEVTNPLHWPKTDTMTMCWLQLARAYAQMDYEQDIPFRIFPMDGAFISGDSEGFADLTKGIDKSRFDVSACP